MVETFWKPEPREPFRDWRTYSMLVPILSSALGACLFMALGFAFAEVVNIPTTTRTPLVLVASFTVAFGSTFGSVGSGIEVFRKSYLGEARRWDWASLIISTATTIAGFAMGFAALLGATTDWSRIALIWGSVVVGTLAALDSSGDMIELGGLFGSYDRRLDEYKRWQYENGLGAQSKSAELESRFANVDEHMRQMESRIAQLVYRWSWPQASKAQFETIMSGLNGDRSEVDREFAILLLAESHLLPPSDQTLGRWIREVREVIK